MYQIWAKFLNTLNNPFHARSALAVRKKKKYYDILLFRNVLDKIQKRINRIDLREHVYKVYAKQKKYFIYLISNKYLISIYK